MAADRSPARPHQRIGIIASKPLQYLGCSLNLVERDKAILRIEARRRRSQVVPEPKDAARAADLFMQTIRPQPDAIVGLYHPLEDEIDTLPLAQRLDDADIVHALPIVRSNSRILRFARWRIGQPVVEGRFRIPEPLHREWLVPDIVVVPLLMFDSQGCRLGYGGGFYDATLAYMKQKKAVLSVGLCYAEQLSETPLPRESHDCRLDFVMTPGQAIQFGDKVHDRQP